MEKLGLKYEDNVNEIHGQKLRRQTFYEVVSMGQVREEGGREEGDKRRKKGKEEGGKEGGYERRKERRKEEKKGGRKVKE